MQILEIVSHIYIVIGQNCQSISLKRIWPGSDSFGEIMGIGPGGSVNFDCRSAVMVSYSISIVIFCMLQSPT